MNVESRCLSCYSRWIPFHCRICHYINADAYRLSNSRQVFCHGFSNLICMTLYVTSVLFLSWKYSFSVLCFYLFLVLVLTYLVVVYTCNYRSLFSVCNRISSFSFHEFYNNLAYSLEYVIPGFWYSSVVLRQLHCILHYFVARKHLVYFVFFS